MVLKKAETDEEDYAWAPHELVKKGILQPYYYATHYYSLFVNRSKEGEVSKTVIDEWMYQVTEMYIRLRDKINKKVDVYGETIQIMEKHITTSYRMSVSELIRCNLALNTFIEDLGITRFEQKMYDPGTAMVRHYTKGEK